MANYIDKKEFDKEMVKCIELGKLTNRAIDFFTLLATEVSKTYKFKHSWDRKFAIDFAVSDFCNYWKGWKWKPVYQLNIVRNFKDNETIKVRVDGGKEHTFIARRKPKEENHFKILETENKSLESLANLVGELTNGDITCTLHKVTRKITFVDNINDVGIYGDITIKTVGAKRLTKPKIKLTEKNLIEDKFTEPSSAFNWGTSVANNGIIKSINELRPKETRNGMFLNFSEIKNKRGGTFDN